MVVLLSLFFLSNGKNYIVAVSKGGVTGFENFGVELNELEKIGRNDWMACCGRRGEWDGLCITKNEMQRLHNKILLSIKESK